MKRCLQLAEQVVVLERRRGEKDGVGEQPDQGEPSLARFHQIDDTTVDYRRQLTPAESGQRDWFAPMPGVASPEAGVTVRQSREIGRQRHPNRFRPRPARRRLFR